MKKKLLIPLIMLVITVIALFGWYFINIHRIPQHTSIIKSPVAVGRKTPNQDGVRHQNVSFKNTHSGLRMSGIIFKPAHFNKNKHYQAIVIAGPMLSVKEQAQSVYAQRLAQRGYVTIVFDHTHFGQSAGKPRQLEVPRIKATDISSALTYLRHRPYVNKDDVYGLGICGGGSYMTYAAALDRRFKSLAVVVPATTMDQFTNRPLKRVAQDKRAYKQGKSRPRYINLMPRFFIEGASYYYNRSRGARSDWSPHAVSWSEESFVKFHPAEQAKKLRMPYLVITGSRAWSKPGAQDLYRNAPVRKQYYEIKGARHFDLYDLDPYVSEATGHINHFFQANR